MDSLKTIEPRIVLRTPFLPGPRIEWVPFTEEQWALLQANLPIPPQVEAMFREWGVIPKPADVQKIQESVGRELREGIEQAKKGIENAARVD